MFFRLIIILLFFTSSHGSALGGSKPELMHGDYSPAYKSDWSKLPSGKNIYRKALNDITFITGFGDSLKRKYIDQEIVNLKDIAYRVSWKKQYNKYRNALFLIRGCEKVYIENIAIIQLDSDYRASHSVFIEDCKEVYLEKSYFSGSCRNYHVRIEGCERVFIDNVEVCGFDYGKEGIRCGGGILVNNGDPKRGGTHGMVSPKPKNLIWCVIQNCYIHDNLDSDEKRNQDGIQVLSASDGAIFNCYFENWKHGDAALDISHRRKDPAYRNKFFRVERNVFTNCSRIKTPGVSHNSCKIFFTNNLYLNVLVVDYHHGWDVYHVNETFVFDKEYKPSVFYSLWGLTDGFSYLRNCLIHAKKRCLKSVYYQREVFGHNEYLALQPDHCVYLMPAPSYWLRGPTTKIFTWNDWKEANDKDHYSILTSKEGCFGKYKESDYALTSKSPAAKYGCKDYLNKTDIKMRVTKDFYGKSRAPSPSAGAFEVYVFEHQSSDFKKD